mgnify:CR=1 FL=1
MKKAWLYKWSRGTYSSTFASIDPDATKDWQTDLGFEVTRTPLCECGPTNTIITSSGERIDENRN